MGNIGSFEINDLFTVGTLALLEGVLSVDNALVLAILVRTLPEHLRKKALNIGVMAAIVFRILAIIFAVFLLKFEAFKLVGGLYLIYIALKHMFVGMDGHKEEGKSGSSYAKVVGALILTDLVFSIDSITTAIAFSDKIWVLWFGGIAGIVLMRFLSGTFVKALEKYPKLEDLAYQLVFFVGDKLVLEVVGVHIDKGVFWMMLGIIAVIGTSMIVRDTKANKASQKRGNELVQMLKEGKITVQQALAEHENDGKVISYLYKEGFLKILD
jgi:YkoY family integral membrane protein